MRASSGKARWHAGFSAMNRIHGGNFLPPWRRLAACRDGFMTASG
jgi:hypothetical protein